MVMELIHLALRTCVGRGREKAGEVSRGARSSGWALVPVGRKRMQKEISDKT